MVSFQFHQNLKMISLCVCLYLHCNNYFTFPNILYSKINFCFRNASLDLGNLLFSEFFYVKKQILYIFTYTFRTDDNKFTLQFFSKGLLQKMVSFQCHQNLKLISLSVCLYLHCNKYFATFPKIAGSKIDFCSRNASVNLGYLLFSEFSEVKNNPLYFHAYILNG